MRSRAKAAASRYARRITAAEPTAFSQREVLSTSPAAILKPSSSAPIGYATAPSKTISPVASARVPSLSLSLRIVKPFGLPSTVRGTRKQPMPRVPSGAPSGRAVTANWSASATEQNHFSPCSRHASPSARRA